MTEQANQGTKKRSTGAYRLIWVVIMIVALLVAVYTVQLWQCTRFTPTGDELYDRYSRAVIGRRAWALFAGEGNPAALPDAVVAEWCEEFGDDPRFWQLRYWCDIHGSEGLYGYPGTDSSQVRRDRAFGWLRQAVDTGAADACTRQLLYADSIHRWKKEMVALDDAGREESIAGVNRIEAEQLAELNAMITADPSSAWSYYLRAKYWFSIGEMDLAIADLATGNSLPDCAVPKAFPAGFVIDRVAADEGVGNPFIAGAILQADEFEPLPNLIKWKEHGKEVMVAAALGGDPAPLTEFHRFSCRMGLADRTYHILLRVGTRIAGEQALYILTELGDGLSPEQRRTLNGVTSLDRELTLTFQTQAAILGERHIGAELRKCVMGGNEKYARHILREPRLPLHRAQAWLEYWELGLPWRGSLYAYAEYRDERKILRNYIQPRIEEIAGLDYAVLAYPEAEKKEAAIPVV